MKPADRLVAWRVAAQIWLWRHGYAWPLGAMTLALAVCVYLAFVPPADAALRAARLDLAQATAQRTRTPGAGSHEQQQDVRALQAVLRHSPSADELVRKMVALSQVEQIALTQSDYQQELRPATQVTQVRVTQPVRASYPQLRRYIESVLRTFPNASLDQVAARRDSVGQSQLEARLRWSFWIQAGAEHPAMPAQGESNP